MKRFFATLLGLCAGLFAADDDLNALLGEYARKADLSQQTKKESGGFLQVYTRQDLDRMQIKQLKELIDKIPFFRYQEDNYGLSDPFYVPYQPSPACGIRVYINDRAVTSAYTNNGLRLFGQMNMSFIDHVEIYLGIPSQTFGIEGAAYVIKLYTKDPDRENTSLLGALLGSRGTRGFYAYDARDDGGFRHFLYADYLNLQRQDAHTPEGNTLRRDKEYANAYGELHNGNHRFEIQLMQGRLDAFLGDSPAMTSRDPSIDFRYGYGGWYYEDDDGLKAFLNYTRSTSDYRDRSSPYPLGAIPTPLGYLPYYSEYSKIEEQFSDAQLKKSFRIGPIRSDSGIQTRYKHFRIRRRALDGRSVEMPHDYDTEFIASLFSENSWMFDESNLLVLSFKADRYVENGGIEDRTLFSGRLGYIYNSPNFTSKSFLMYLDSSASMMTLYHNRYLYGQEETPGIEHSFVAATKLIYKNENRTYSFLVGRTMRDNGIYFRFDSPTGPRYDNFEEASVFDSFLVEYENRFDPLNTFKCHAWEVISKYGNGLGSGKTWGALASLTNTFDRFTLHNNLVYKYYRSSGGPGLNWNLALTYHRSRALTLYLKADNILGRALEQNYYTYLPPALDPALTGKTVSLGGVSVFDTRVWCGLEYQF